MWAYTDEEIDFLASTPSTGNGGGRVAPAATVSVLRTAGTDAAPSSPRPGHDDGKDGGGAGSTAPRTAPARAPRISWARRLAAAKQLPARLDPAVAKLNTVLLIAAGLLAYIDFVAYFALKAWSSDVDWAILLQTYAAP